MKVHLIKIAEENRHWMVPISLDRFECVRCEAVIENDQTGCDSWSGKKINVWCPKIARLRPLNTQMKVL